MRWLAAILVLSLAPTTVLAEFGDADYMREVHGALGKPEMKQLLRVLAEPEAILGDLAAASAHLAPIAAIGTTPGYASGAPALPGILAADLDSSPDAPRRFVLSLLFETDDDRSRFFSGLERAYGPAEPECSNEQVAHWLFGPEQSANWRAMDYETVEAQLTIQAVDPEDANCPRSTASADKLVSEDQAELFLIRLRDEPPPFDSTKALTRWLSPYASVEIDNTDPCDIALNSPYEGTGVDGLNNLQGMNFVVAGIRNCAEPALSSFLSLSSFYGPDMFGQQKFTRAAEAVFGAPHEPCTDRYQQAWDLGDGRSLLVNNAYLSFTATTHDVALGSLGCELENPVR